MAMNIGSGGDSGDPDVVVDVNTTPLIDVMLVLLVMLIITIPVQTHAVKMDMPQATPPSDNLPPPPTVELEIDFDGTIIWNGETIPDRATLESRLLQAAHETQQPEFHIRPNRLVEYKYVAAVLAMDRTTLTAALKPLERRGLVRVEADPRDRRGRLLRLTQEGRRLLTQAFPIWKETHEKIDRQLSTVDMGVLRAGMIAIT